MTQDHFLPATNTYIVISGAECKCGYCGRPFFDEQRAHRHAKWCNIKWPVKPIGLVISRQIHRIKRYLSRDVEDST